MWRVILLNTYEQLIREARGERRVLAVPGQAGDIRGWRVRLVRQLRRSMGLAAKRGGRPVVRVRERYRHDDVRVHRLEIGERGEAGFQAVVLEPVGLSGRAPGWLCLHGCIAGGMASVTGLTDDCPAGAESLVQFEDDYGWQLARRGNVTLSFDFPGFGSRCAEGDGQAQTPVRDHRLIFSALALGRPLLGWCLSDAVTALTVLCAWPTVRAGRLGVTGFSMGGTLGGMLAAADRRVKAAAVSGRFTSWRERLMQGRIDGLTAVPGLIHYMDVADILAAVAPTRLFVSQEARGDGRRARQLLAPVRKGYRARDAVEKLSVYYDQGDRHRFVGEPLYEWIDRVW